MRSLLMVCVMVGLAMLPCVAGAAEVGQVSDATLAQMGLGGMQQMTDVQGLNIRGSGFAAAGGYSKATWFSASTANAYVGVSLTKWADAGGTTSSLAGSTTVKTFPSGATFSVVRGVVAVGSSSAYAK
jgi:hypothetical protein